MHSRFVLATASLVTACATACAAPTSTDLGSTSQPDIADIASMTERGDGSFDVTCRDGRHEIVSAADVSANRVCAAPPAVVDPFAPGTCTGTPMTEASALARFDEGAVTGSKVIGRFSLSFRLRDTTFSGPGWHNYVYTWRAADPTFSLVAWRETGNAQSSGAKAQLAVAGDVELVLEAGKPSLRLVADASDMFGPNTTKQMRFVSDAIVPWANGGAMNPRLGLETNASSPASWRAPSDYGYSVQTSENARTLGHKEWWYFGVNGSAAIVTDRCLQIASDQPTGSLSAIDTAMAFYATFNP